VFLKGVFQKSFGKKFFKRVLKKEFLESVFDTVHDPKLSHLFSKTKPSKKETFTKQKKGKNCDNLFFKVFGGR